MFTKIIEADDRPFWLKVVIATYEPEEIEYNSALPGYEDNNLFRNCERAHPDDIWILDLSTGEGANFNLNDEPEYRISTVDARL